MVPRSRGRRLRGPASVPEYQGQRQATYLTLKGGPYSGISANVFLEEFFSGRKFAFPVVPDNGTSLEQTWFAVYVKVSSTEAIYFGKLRKRKVDTVACEVSQNTTRCGGRTSQCPRCGQRVCEGCRYTVYTTAKRQRVWVCNDCVPDIVKDAR